VRPVEGFQPFCEGLEPRKLTIQKVKVFLQNNARKLLGLVPSSLNQATETAVDRTYQKQL